MTEGQATIRLLPPGALTHCPPGVKGQYAVGQLMQRGQGQSCCTYRIVRSDATGVWGQYLFSSLPDDRPDFDAGHAKR